MGGRKEADLNRIRRMLENVNQVTQGDPGKIGDYCFPGSQLRHST